MSAIILGIFGLLKGLAWPLTVLLIVKTLKPEILSLLPDPVAWLRRSRKLKVAGLLEIEVDAAGQQQKTLETASATIVSGNVELREIPGLTRTEAIAELERNLHFQLKSVTAEPVDVLVRNLAQALLEAAFGLIYAGIFGSQIEALIALEGRRVVTNDEIHKFYLKFEQKFPEVYQTYGFSGWLGFMKTNGLIVQQDVHIKITAYGDDFLGWLRAKQLSIKRPW